MDRPPEPAFSPLRPQTPESLSKPRRAHILWWLFLGGLALGIASYLIIHYWEALWVWLSPYWELFTNKARVKAAIKAAGPLAPLLFITLQALQVVLAPIPGEATGFIGGYLFGVPLGLLYSTLGLTSGSALAFGLGHWLEKRFVARLISPATLQKFDFLMERQGALVSFILFLIPGFPKDALCFILGLSPMDFRVFLVISTLGRLPGTLMLTLQGAQVYQGNYWISVILMASCLILAGGAYVYRETFYDWIKRLEEYRRNSKSPQS